MDEHRDKLKNPLLDDHKTKSWVKIIEKIYLLNLDNRILNNLR